MIHSKWVETYKSCLAPLSLYHDFPPLFFPICTISGLPLLSQRETCKWQYIYVYYKICNIFVAYLSCLGSPREKHASDRTSMCTKSIILFFKYVSFFIIFFYYYYFLIVDISNLIFVAYLNCLCFPREKHASDSSFMCTVSRFYFP